MVDYVSWWYTRPKTVTHLPVLTGPTYSNFVHSTNDANHYSLRCYINAVLLLLPRRHLIHGSLGPPESSTQTAFQSVHPFFHSSLVWQTDRQTDHATRSITVRCIYTGSTEMRRNNNNNKNTNDNVYGAVIMARPLREFTWFIWWMQTECHVAVNPQTKPNDFGCESAGRLLPSTSMIAV